MTTIHGGKGIYGATVGILMLDARFPRIEGDIGNAVTWPFPVHYRLVEGASPDKIVRQDPREMLEAFITEGRALVRMGCDGIATNCGFLALLQDDLRAALGVPVTSSSLMQVPMVQATLPPGRGVGILTISRETLSPAHLAAVGVPPETPVMGTEGGHFSEAILDNHLEMDFEQCRVELITAAQALITAHPTTGAIVLECTNMVPYARDIRVATGLPVFSIYSLITWFQSALSPRGFALRLDDPRYPG